MKYAYLMQKWATRFNSYACPLKSVLVTCSKERITIEQFHLSGTTPMCHYYNHFDAYKARRLV